MKLKATRYFILAAVAAAIAACSREILEPPEPVPAERVFLMYDNIGSWFDDDVTEAGKAVAAGALGAEERVVVYERKPSGNVIYELVRDAAATNGYREEVLKTYAAGENPSLDGATIARVVGDVRTLVPAPHYGLAFGSHGLGWIPKSNTAPIARRDADAVPGAEHPFAVLWAGRENPRTRYFASDTKQKLDVAEFADALNEWAWDFVILDDCFMASVESLYEMRGLADYIIASPTEIMWPGFHYGLVVNAIFTEWENDLQRCVAAVGEDFVEDYRSGASGRMGGSAACATVAVVKMSGMEPLAAAVRELGLSISDLAPTVEGIQFYEGISTPGHVFFDFEQYLSGIRAATMPTEFGNVEAQLARTVVYADHTATFYTAYSDDYPPIHHYSGLNVFIPHAATAPLFGAYRQTEWYEAVYAE